MNCNNPFFIVGSVRTGTTLLRRMLFNHPDVYIPPETYWIPKAYAKFIECHKARYSWSTAVNEVLGIFESDRYYKDTFSFPLAPLRKKLYQMQSNTLSFNEIMNGFYFYHAALNGKGNAIRWGDKTPCYTYNLPLLIHVWPNAKFLFMDRDPIDCIASSLKAGIYKKVSDACQRWTDAQKHYNDFVKDHSQSIKAIGYENLVTEPVKTLKEVCSFIDLDYRESLHEIPNKGQLSDVTVHDHLSNAAKPLFTDSIGKGKRTLTEEQLNEIRTIIYNEPIFKDVYRLTCDDEECPDCEQKVR